MSLNRPQVTPVSQLLKLNSYQPPPTGAEIRERFGVSKAIHLAANENPLGPSPEVLKALKSFDFSLNRYPEASARPLKKKLTEMHQVASDQLIFGNGSNEIIDLLVQTYCGTGDSLLTSQSAFLVYRMCAAIHAVGCVEVPMTVDNCFDLKKMAEEVVANPKVKLVFIANPNNPTGTFVDKKAIEEFLAAASFLEGRSVIVVLDCAYWEYVDNPTLEDPICFLEKYPNLVVLRTFSKIYGMAGLRIGYGVSSAETIGFIERVRQPFNTNSIALLAAELALSDQGFVERSISANRQAIAFWQASLKSIGVPCMESKANFLLANFEQYQLLGSDIAQRCLSRGLLLQPVANYGFSNCLRITMGTAQENETAFGILKEALK